MSILTRAVRDKRNLHLARVSWALAAMFGLISFAVLIIIPEVSLLAQPDGKRFLYINREFDLPTGDEAIFSDYSLLPVCGVIAGCSAFYLLTGAFFWARQANLTSAVDGGNSVLPDAVRPWLAATNSRGSPTKTLKQLILGLKVPLKVDSVDSASRDITRHAQIS